jgi:hypothetical protein
MTTQPQTPTLAEDLRGLLAELSDHLEMATCYLGDVHDTVVSTRAFRLELFDWFLSEGLGQVDELTDALGTLLEPPHSGRTRYGRKHGVYIQVPLDWAKCGTPANCRAHQRRGEAPCGPCRKAAARSQADRRQRRKSLAHSTITITQLGESKCR